MPRCGKRQLLTIFGRDHLNFQGALGLETAFPQQRREFAGDVLVGIDRHKQARRVTHDLG